MERLLSMSQKRKLIVHEQAKSPIAEAFRTLRTNIQFAKIDGEVKTLVFTSAGPGEGKSTVTANTAVALAQSGKKIILVDCDLRKPVQHKVFGKKNKGLTNALVDDVSPMEFVQDTEIDNLQVLTSGPIPPNPSELLGSGSMIAIIEELKQHADIVILDAPPVIAVTDACVLAAKVDGVIMVIGAGIVRPEMAKQAKDLLVRAKGNIIGVVLNRVEIEEEHSYYYYYYGEKHRA